MGSLTEKLEALMAHPALAPAHRRWNLLPPFAQHLLKSLLIGAIAAAVLHLARPYVPGLAGAETTATDWAIRFWQDRFNTARATDEQFVFFDIDERTYRAWGEPLFVPRDKLLQLIRFAAEAPARLLVVDVELTKHVPLPARPSAIPSSPAEAALPMEPDRALADYLRRYSERSRTSTSPPSSFPHMIFARTIGPQTPSDDHPGGAPGVATLREERPSEFLEAVMDSSPVLHWASPLSDRDDDGLVRNWRLFEPTCLVRSPHAIPSMALLSWAVLRTPVMSRGSFSPASFQEELQRRFAPSAATCFDVRASLPASTPSPAPWVLYDRVLEKRLHLSAKPLDLEQRIFYKFQISTRLADSFSRVPALLITERTDQPLSPDLVAGKTVVIGSSYEAGKDLHETPIGEMPGAMVVINQINALMEFGQFQEVSRAIRWTGLLLLIVVFSLSFSFFTKTWGAQVSTLIINAVLLPVSLWLFQYGWWLDLVFPLFVLQAYQRFIDIDVTPPPVIRRHRHANEGT
jgi:CHASE2 domain-containing sensor protein